ncbi:MAG TPA: molybdopterin-binding protein [Hyphomonadaceae bacterium]|jgi:molybdenum cofactor synthesis domain-containing protein
MARTVTAAVILIGDELLSGRTQDSNLRTIAEFLNPLGVEVREARVIADVHDTIVATVQHLRKTYDYVFTTGGIGPTHDDITADAVAAAFGRTIDVRPDAVAILKPWYEARGQELNEGRLRMARIPAGADLIANPASAAPGFMLGNVIVLAGIPAVMRAMLQDVGHRIQGGAIVHSHTVRGAGIREGEIAEPLGALAKARPEVSFGSYPWMRLKGKTAEFGVNLVARSRDPDLIAASVAALVEIVRAQGAEPEVDPDADDRSKT